MKKVLLLLIILTGFKLSVQADDLDSLKQNLQVTTNDTVKADIYLKMAKAYLGIKTPYAVYRSRNGENAVNYTLLALHLYSKMEDSTGIRKCYTSLSRGYRVQKHYTQAKWFMVQSSVVAKDQKDIPDMIASLVELADIKAETGDYILAKKDLSYALRLTSKYNVPDYQENIIQSLAIVNNGIKNLPEDQELKDAKELSAGYSTIITDGPVITVAPEKATGKSTKGKSKSRAYRANVVVNKKNAKAMSTDKLASL